MQDGEEGVNKLGYHAVTGVGSVTFSTNEENRVPIRSLRNAWQDWMSLLMNIIYEPPCFLRFFWHLRKRESEWCSEVCTTKITFLTNEKSSFLTKKEFADHSTIIAIAFRCIGMITISVREGFSIAVTEEAVVRYMRKIISWEIPLNAISRCVLCREIPPISGQD